MPYPKSAPEGAAESGREPRQVITPSPAFPEIETDVLAFWAEDGTFRASVENREGAPEWVFYDGPPFANGLPHYGHLLTGYAKDVFPRFQTMRGKKVERRFGWDTHGLPAELEAERQLGITDKSQIEEMGLAAFNQAAKDSVLRYTREWQEYVTRQARWVDFDNDYKTLDTSYMESVIWAFKKLHEKGLAYEGYRVLPYCWRDQTPLSNHELRMDDDVYKMRQDQTVTVTFPLTGAKAEALGLTGVRALAWTTTPWTLPTNLALVVGPDIEYAVVPAGPNGTADVHGRGSGRHSAALQEESLSGEYLLAVDLVGNYAKDLGYGSAGGRARGDQPHGRRARPAGRDLRSALGLLRRHREVRHRATRGSILVDDYVTTDDGTGIVHQAPAYGEDDQRVCEAAGIPVIISVDDGARFLPDVQDVAGLQVFEANKPLTTLLREEGRLLRQASYEHSYPHCWRCRNPLIYKAVSSWFVRVTAFRDRMVELNQRINWVPENVKDGQFGKWLAGARDWSIVAQPLLRLADPGVEERRPRPPARRRVRLARGARARLRAAAGQRRGRARPAPAVHRRAHPTEPGRPDGRLHDAPHPGRARRVVRLRVDAVRPGALPVREPRLVRQPQPGRLHRRVHRPDARLVLLAAHARHGAVRPAGVQERDFATASCWAATGRRCRSRCATTPTSTRSSTATAPTRCAGS